MAYGQEPEKRSKAVQAHSEAVHGASHDVHEADDEADHGNVHEAAKSVIKLTFQ